MQKFLSWILVIVGALHALLPVAPRGDKLNLDGYSLVFCDEFEGSELDTDVWYHRGVGSRRVGYNAESQVRVEDGKLILRGEYLTDGEYGEGWYTAALAEGVLSRGGRVAGVDLSKAAVRRAARRCPGAEIAVASVYRLPVPEASVSTLSFCSRTICSGVKRPTALRKLAISRSTRKSSRSTISSSVTGMTRYPLRGRLRSA